MHVPKRYERRPRIVKHGEENNQEPKNVSVVILRVFFANRESLSSFATLNHYGYRKFPRSQEVRCHSS